MRMFTNLHIRVIVYGFMKQPIKPIPFPNWIKPKQKKHLVELRFNRLIQDDDIKTLIQEKIDVECEKMRKTIKELKK